MTCSRRCSWRSNDEPAQWAERGAIRSHWHTGQVESAASAERGPEVRFAALPGRLFLDSSTLQTLLDYGVTIFEGERPPPRSRAYRIAGYLDDLDALRLTFLVNERAGFDFVLSEASLDEVGAKREPRYLQWALDVLDQWQIRVWEYQGGALDGSGARLAARLSERRFGYLSAKDKRLLRDAIELECDAFLTMEKKLARQAEHLRAELEIRLLRPPDYWALLEPWAGLYR
jgi:hypothetical protein